MEKYVILIAFCAAIGCNPSVNKSAEEQILIDLNNKYDSIKLFFGAEMTSHFPDKVTNRNISFTEGLSPKLGNLELIFIDSMDISASEVSEDFERKSISVYGANDSCLFVVNRFVSRDNYYNVKPSAEEMEHIDLECYKGLFPVPNFWHNKFTTNETNCRLPADFKIYVIKSKAGKYLDDRYLTEGWFMPKEWKNGYSKGVAISEDRNIIIYWLTIW
jgi:hypothetical protein